MAVALAIPLLPGSSCMGKRNGPLYCGGSVSNASMAWERVIRDNVMFIALSGIDVRRIPGSAGSLSNGNWGPRSFLVGLRGASAHLGTFDVSARPMQVDPRGSKVALYENTLVEKSVYLSILYR